MKLAVNEFRSGMYSRFWRISKVVIIATTIFGLVSLNILTLIDARANAAGIYLLKSVLSPAVKESTLSRILRQSLTEKYGALEKSHRDLEARHIKLEKASAIRSQVVKNITTRIAGRAIANAGKNVSAYAAELVPVISVATVAAITISDIYDDCQTLKDLNELSSAFEHPNADESTVCGINLAPDE